MDELEKMGAGEVSQRALNFLEEHKEELISD
jgi:hypothetical protein